MNCIYCNSNNVYKDGNHNGYQRYKCLDCKKRFDGEEYSDNYIEHFGVRLKDKDKNKLSRENYCVPTNKPGSQTKRLLEQVDNFRKNNIKVFAPPYFYDFPNEVFVDKNTYTDNWVKNHYDECLYNFDLNIKYFNSIDKDKFYKRISVFVKKNKLKQVFDLNEAEVTGIYIMVLDEYKQVYIGISSNIKKRILRHWSVRKDFDTLIFGPKEKSILSIDSFGALDTTRIYIKEPKWYQNINKIEEKMISELEGEYTLNRINGGLNDDLPDITRYMSAMESMKKRNL